MVQYTRRRIIRRCGAVLPFAFSGCMSVSDSFSEPPILGALEAQNHDETTHTLQVMLSDNSEPVYWTLARVSPANDSQLGGHVFDGFPTRRGDYTLYAKADEQPKSDWKKLEFGEYDASCIGVIIAIGREERDLVTLLTTTDSDICDDSATSS